MIRGIGSAEHLYAWFAEKGQSFVPVSVADVFAMDIDGQRLFVEVKNMMLRLEGASEVGRQALQAAAYRGYFLLPVESLQGMTISQLEVVQLWITLYMDKRRARGKPMITASCECGGIHNCTACGGTGQTTTLGELTKLEVALATGTSWDQIDKENIDG